MNICIGLMNVGSVEIAVIAEMTVVRWLFQRIWLKWENGLVNLLYQCITFIPTVLSTETSTPNPSPYPINSLATSVSVHSNIYGSWRAGDASLPAFAGITNRLGHRKRNTLRTLIGTLLGKLWHCGVVRNWSTAGVMILMIWCSEWQGMKLRVDWDTVQVHSIRSNRIASSPKPIGLTYCNSPPRPPVQVTTPSPLPSIPSNGQSLRRRRGRGMNFWNLVGMLMGRSDRHLKVYTSEIEEGIEYCIIIKINIYRLGNTHKYKKNILSF